MKVCTHCDRELPVDCFSHKTPTRLNSWCKDCQKQRSKEWYQNNKARHIENIVRNTADFSSTVMEWKKQQQCFLCNENYTACLEFHHLESETKEAIISNLMRCNSWTRLVDELNKCIILCANCHRKVHHGGIILPSGMVPLNVTKDALVSSPASTRSLTT